MKIYARKFPYACAKLMIRMWRIDEGIDEFPAVHRDEFPHVGGLPGNWIYTSKLLDRMTGTPQQGGYGTLGHNWRRDAADAWQATRRLQAGRLVAAHRPWPRVRPRRVKVPRDAYIYNAKCLGWGGPEWTIRDALTSEFDYDELMGR